MTPLAGRAAGRRAGFWRLARGCVLVLALGWPAAPAPVQAEGGVIEAPDALALSRDGKLTIIDVRTEQEWVQTGIPENARPVSLYPKWGVANPDFVEDVLKAVGGDTSAPIALVCASGSRSTFAQGLLEQAGFSTVYSISEGMVGSAFGPGWIARGLPTEPCTSC